MVEVARHAFRARRFGQSLEAAGLGALVPLNVEPTSRRTTGGT
jgi:hypothetical protein